MSRLIMHVDLDASEEDIPGPDVRWDTLHQAAAEIGSIARQAGRKGTVVTLTIRFRGFEMHARSRTLALSAASNRARFGMHWALYEAGAWAGKPVHLIGVDISGRAQADAAQPDMLGADISILRPKRNGSTRRYLRSATGSGGEASSEGCAGVKEAMSSSGSVLDVLPRCS